jgi:hypothetical protein
MSKKTLNKNSKETVLPEFFKPILWSYDFSLINPEKNRKIIIINAINYGNLDHWRWLLRYYGKKAIKETLETIPATEIKPRARKLASLVFSVKNFNYAPRSVKR